MRRLPVCCFLAAAGVLFAEPSWRLSLDDGFIEDWQQMKFSPKDFKNVVAIIERHHFRRKVYNKSICRAWGLKYVLNSLSPRHDIYPDAFAAAHSGELALRRSGAYRAGVYDRYAIYPVPPKKPDGTQTVPFSNKFIRRKKTARALRRAWEDVRLSDHDFWKTLRFIESRLRPEDRENMHLLYVKSAVGYIQGLDPMAHLYSPQTYYRFQKLRKQRSFIDLGLYLRKEPDGTVQVESVAPDRLSDLAGVLPGDTLLSVNGKTVERLSLSRIYKILCEEKNSTVTLKISRFFEAAPLNIKIKQTPVVFQNIRSRLLFTNIAYLRLAGFTFQSDGHLALAYTGLKKKADQKMRGLILDLRGNGGGYSHVAISIIDFFLDRGLILDLTDWTGFKKKYYASRKMLVPKDMPLAILVNARSASASEWVAGVLQQKGRAVIIGERTYGKGTYQIAVPEKPHYPSYWVQVTLGRAEFADFRTPHLDGILPDISISKKGDQKFPGRFRMEDLWHHIDTGSQHRRFKTHEQTAGVIRKMKTASRGTLKHPSDHQLLTAVDYIRAVER